MVYTLKDTGYISKYLLGGARGMKSLKKCSKIFSEISQVLIFLMILTFIRFYFTSDDGNDNLRISLVRWMCVFFFSSIFTFSMSIVLKKVIQAIQEEVSSLRTRVIELEKHCGLFDRK